MAFDRKLTAAMSGLTPSQLNKLRRDGLVVPELEGDAGLLYSFRDVLALRTFAKLRSEVSMQKVKAAFDTLRTDLRLTDHPSRYELVSSEKSIRLVERKSDDGAIVTDLLKGGQIVLATLADVMAPFDNFRGQPVVDFRRPRRHLRVDDGRMGGLPTAEGTRVPYVVIADLLRDGSIPAQMIQRYYPSVSVESALDAVDFDAQVRGDQEVAA